MDKKLMAENLCGYTIELVQCDTDTCGIPPTEEIVGPLRLVKLHWKGVHELLCEISEMPN